MNRHTPLSALLLLSCDGKPTDTPTSGDTGDIPATYTPITIDFDDLTEQIEVDTLYAEHITFEVADGLHLFSWDVAPLAPSPPFAAYTTSMPLGPGTPVDIAFIFARPVRALHFTTFADDTTGALAQIDILTEDGGLQTEQLVGDADQGTPELTDLSGSDDIVRIDIHDIIDSGSVAFDDITFEIRDE